MGPVQGHKVMGDGGREKRRGKGDAGKPNKGVWVPGTAVDPRHGAQRWKSSLTTSQWLPRQLLASGAHLCPSKHHME